MRFVPPGGLYSVELPATPRCDVRPDSTDCVYDNPASAWTFRVRHQKIRLQSHDTLVKNPSWNLQNLVNDGAGDEGQEVLLNKATVADGFAAADYRLGPKSDSPSAPHSAGRFINLGDKVVQIVQLNIDGKQAPPEDVLQRFVNSFRAVEGGNGLAPLPPSSASLVQGSLLKPGVFTYQRITETAPKTLPWSQINEEAPLDYSTQLVKRTIQRKRDKNREALVITETSRTPKSSVEHRFWLDAKTLIPYRVKSRWSELVSMSKKDQRRQTRELQMELSNGVMRGEIKGAFGGKFERPLGETPHFLAGAPLELVVASLPLEVGFLGSLRLFELHWKDHFSDWRVLVQYAPKLQSISDLETPANDSLKTFKVDLIEHKAESPRRYTIWIEDSPARRILQVEEFATASESRPRTTVDMLQTQR